MENQTDVAGVEDRDILVHDRFAAMQRRFLKTLVSEEIIEEHRRKPLGQHSEPLERILHFFRRSATERYALKRNTATGTYRIIALSGIRGVGPRFVDEMEYQTLEAGYHGVFLKQLNDMLRS